MTSQHKKTRFAFVLGLLVGALTTSLVLPNDAHSPSDNHPIGYADQGDEVHVHSDFIVYLDGEAYDLTDDKYQSKAAYIKHEHIHLHDNNDDVIHRHDHDITLVDFFSSLGFTITNECLTTDNGEDFCNNDTEKLMLFVNGEVTESIADYENQEEDQILIYYGNPADPIVKTLLNEITDRSCIYSGTCPERGTAPPEECGLTCEL